MVLCQLLWPAAVPMAHVKVVLLERTAIMCAAEQLSSTAANYERAERLAAWCIDHEIVLKLLQASDATVQTAIGPEFVSMARRMIDRFSLTLGVIATFSEYYGMVRGVPLIYFFHSHCRVRECEICSKIHIRVTADGFIKACILNDVKYPLLTGRFDECMLKVMCHSGRPPDTGALRWGTRC